MRYLLLLILSFGIATACGGDGEEGKGDSTSLRPLGERITETHCGRVLSCCSAAELAAAFGGIPVSNQEECVSAVEGIVQVNVIPRYQSAVDEGTVVYESADIQNCIDGLNRLACESFEPDPRFAISEIPSCRGLFEAQLETTEFCTEDFECKSGFCALTAAGDEGTCAEEPQQSESCIANRCAFGLYCDEGTCEAQAPDGMGCEFDAQCESNNCVDVSDPESAADLRCRPLPPACGG